MADKNYKQLLKIATDELTAMESHLSGLKRQIKEISERIEIQKEGIRGLAKLSDQKEVTELPIDAVKPLASVRSLTNAIRFVLKTSRQPFAPMELRAKMEVWGYDTARYNSNFLASVHTVLRRLISSKEVRPVRINKDKVAYEWITEFSRCNREIFILVFGTARRTLQENQC